MLFPILGRVYAWRTLKEAYNPKCLVPTVKHGGGSGMIWAVTSRYSAGHTITLNGRNTVSDYVDILGNQVHPVVQVFFPDNDAIFQEDDSPKHTVRRIESWFEDHEDSLRHLHWPAQSPPLNITESL
jgi:hypothetical protein